jgi:hypothetical protein
MKPRSSLVLLLCLTAVVHISASGQKKTLVKERLNEDVQGVSSIVGLIPSEQQNIERLKSQLRKDWHVEETDPGFKGKYLELEKGWGYSKGYVHALIYDGCLAENSTAAKETVRCYDFPL